MTADAQALTDALALIGQFRQENQALRTAIAELEKRVADLAAENMALRGQPDKAQRQAEPPSLPTSGGISSVQAIGPMSEHDSSGEYARGRLLIPQGHDVEPIQVTSGPALCDLCVWTEEEWAALPLAKRPADHTYVPGIGWIGAVPRLFMN
jgi:hypothetical protein